MGAAVGCLCKRHVMPSAREIAEGVGSEEGLDVPLKGFGRGEQAADMGIDAADDKLVTPARAHKRVEIAALEGAVAMLDQHHVRALRLERRDDRLMIGDMTHARPPEIGLQSPVAPVLVAMLRGIEDREPRRASRSRQRRDVGHQAGHGIGVGREGVDEIALHVVDQQRGATRLQGPVGPRGRPFALHGKRIGLDRGQPPVGGHASFSCASNVARRLARNSLRLILPTAVVANSGTKMI